MKLGASLGSHGLAALLGALLLVGCDDREPTGHIFVPPPDGGPGAAGGSGGTGGSASHVPEEEIVSHDLPPLTSVGHVCVEGWERPNKPSVHVLDDKLWLFFNAVSGAAGETTLYLHTSPLGALTLDAARDVHRDGYQTDLVRDGSTLWAAVAGGFLSSFLVRSDDDGATWHHEQTFAAGNGSATCSYQVPLYFFRPLQSDFKMALGYDVDSHIFGCGHQVYYSRLVGSEWQEPIEVGKGAPAGAVVDDSGLVVGATAGVYTSPSEAGPFEQVPGGDTTAEQLRGDRLIEEPSGRLLLVQSYDYASAHKVALLFGSDAGTTWTRKLIVNQVDPDTYIIEPTVAAVGDLVLVAWMAGDRNDVRNGEMRYYATVTHSPDGGQSWSEPARFDQAPVERNVASISLASDGSRVFGAYAESADSMYYDFENVCVTALDL